MKYITCIHCHHKYEDTLPCCPICLEPKPKPKQSYEEIAKETRHSGVLFFKLLYVLLAMFFIIGFAFVSIEAAAACLFLYFLAGLIVFKKLDDFSKQEIVVTDEMKKNIQFNMDDTSICPKCGSHQISYGRKRKPMIGFSVYDLYIFDKDNDEIVCICDYCGKRWVSKQKVWND